MRVSAASPPPQLLDGPSGTASAESFPQLPAAPPDCDLRPDSPPAPAEQAAAAAPQQPDELDDAQFAKLVNDTERSLAAERFADQFSMLHRLEPELLRAVNERLLAIHPGKYTEVYDAFELGNHGVTFIAFYRYARRLRAHAARLEADQIRPEPNDQSQRDLPALYAQRLLEALTLDHPSPIHLRRLAEGYKLVAGATAELKKNDLLPDPVDGPELTKLVGAVRTIFSATGQLRMQRAHMQIQQEMQKDHEEIMARAADRTGTSTAARNRGPEAAEEIAADER